MFALLWNLNILIFYLFFSFALIFHIRKLIIQEKIPQSLFKKISLNLEKGIFNYAIQTAKQKNIVRKWDNDRFVLIYIDKFRSILVNINAKSTVKNTQLLKRLKKGEFKAHELAFMSHQELYPEKWKSLIEEKIKRDQNEGKVDLSAATDEFYCFRCKKRKSYKTYIY